MMLLLLLSFFLTPSGLAQNLAPSFPFVLEDAYPPPGREAQLSGGLRRTEEEENLFSLEGVYRQGFNPEWSVSLTLPLELGRPERRSGNLEARILRSFPEKNLALAAGLSFSTGRGRGIGSELKGIATLPLPGGRFRLHTNLWWKYLASPGSLRRSRFGLALGYDHSYAETLSFLGSIRFEEAAAPGKERFLLELGLLLDLGMRTALAGSLGAGLGNSIDRFTYTVGFRQGF